MLLMRGDEAGNDDAITKPGVFGGDATSATGEFFYFAFANRADRDPASKRRRTGF